jgi:ketosteroid isomerase-like protein
MTFTPHILHVGVHGESAWVVCIEEITSRHADEEHASQVLATNLFERRGRQWLMVHHHSSPVFRAASPDGES